MSTTYSKKIAGHDFKFQPFEINQETGYHVDVTDDTGQRWEFRMLLDDGGAWELEGENLPRWISNAKPELVQAINEHE